MRQQENNAYLIGIEHALDMIVVNLERGYELGEILKAMRVTLNRRKVPEVQL